MRTCLPADAKKYMINKTVLGCGAPTAVITGIIAYFLLRNATAVFNLSAITNDLAGGLIPTGFIIPLILIFIARSEYRKGATPDMGFTKDSHAFYRWFPGNVFLDMIYICIFNLIIFLFIPLGFFTFFKINLTFSWMSWVVLKTLYTLIFASWCAWVSYAVVISGPKK